MYKYIYIGVPIPIRQAYPYFYGERALRRVCFAVGMSYVGRIISPQLVWHSAYTTSSESLTEIMRMFPNLTLQKYMQPVRGEYKFILGTFNTIRRPNYVVYNRNLIF